jgi:hypothetical protein
MKRRTEREALKNLEPIVEQRVQAIEESLREKFAKAIQEEMEAGVFRTGNLTGPKYFVWYSEAGRTTHYSDKKYFDDSESAMAFAKEWQEHCRKKTA